MSPIYLLVCPHCGLQIKIHVRSILAQTAQCPHCSGSLREICDPIGDRHDDQVAQIKELMIVVSVFETHGIEPSDEDCETHLPGSESAKRTIPDLAAALARIPGAEAIGDPLEAIETAIASSHPDLARPYSHTLPLIDAVDGNRHARWAALKSEGK